MPWAAPIGTGQGPRNPRALRELRERAPQIPLIVDAGIGLPSQACQVMEWGFDGVLLNTAVSRASILFGWPVPLPKPSTEGAAPSLLDQ